MTIICFVIFKLQTEIPGQMRAMFSLPANYIAAGYHRQYHGTLINGVPGPTLTLLQDYRRFTSSKASVADSMSTNSEMSFYSRSSDGHGGDYDVGGGEISGNGGGGGDGHGKESGGKVNGEGTKDRGRGEKHGHKKNGGGEHAIDVFVDNGMEEEVNDGWIKVTRGKSNRLIAHRSINSNDVNIQKHMKGSKNDRGQLPLLTEEALMAHEQTHRQKPTVTDLLKSGR